MEKQYTVTAINPESQTITVNFQVGPFNKQQDVLVDLGDDANVAKIVESILDKFADSITTTVATNVVALLNQSVSTGSVDSIAIPKNQGK